MSVFRGDALQKWVWIELTGFDAERDDFGVPDFIARAGFVPDGFSLLLYWAGFPVNHADMDEERPLSVCEDSYGGHEYCPERRRQNWTNFQLRALIARLRSLGSKVYLSYFNMDAYTDDGGNRVVCDYFRDKGSLRETDRAGKPAGGLHMLKRLPDGSYFSDFLQEKTVRALVDYGFDGLQIADGISSPRVALQEGDFSDDMVGQFLARTGVALPDGRDRADYIWRERRAEWIRFHALRWAEFYDSFLRRLRAAGKEAVFNSAWTRDPLEAMYRYGVDYRLAARSGIGGCMVEDVSAGLSILSEQDNGYLMTDAQRRRVHYEFLATLMLNRAAMPAARITPLSGIHDTMEQWGVLEHMPTAMTRNVMTNLNTFFFSGGRLKPVTDGPFFCLCDSLKASDWDFIRANWEIGYTETPVRAAGATVVWSDAKLDAELSEFIRARRTPTGRLLSELLYGCAPVPAVARAEEIGELTGAILVANPELLPEAERGGVLAYAGGPVLAIGTQTAPPEGFAPLVVEQNGFGGAWLAIRGASARACATVENGAAYGFDPKLSMEPVRALWTHPLTYAPISARFFALCADAITELTGAPVLAGTARSCKMICVFVSEDACRVFLSNDDYHYNHPTLDMRREIASIRCLTKYAGYKVSHEGSRFTARVPGRGMEAFELTLA